VLKKAFTGPVDSRGHQVYLGFYFGVDWVEKDTHPDRIEATGRAFPGRSRPLCPFPQYAYYTGKGDSEDAANFECQNPG
jgi:hypothetical protein